MHTLLAVDDDPLVRRMLSRVLRPHFTVVEAESASIALARLASGETFDVILCDVLVAGMSGVELYQRLAASGDEHASRFVALTGKCLDDLDPAFCESLGPRLLFKPCTNAELLAALRSVIEPSAAA